MGSDIVSWLCLHLEEDSNGKIEKNELLQRFNDHQFIETPSYTAMSMDIFSKYVQTVFPCVKMSKLRDGGNGKRKLVYSGVRYFIEEQCEDQTYNCVTAENFDVSKVTFPYFCSQKEDENHVFYIKANISINGNQVLKKVSIDFQNKCWKMEVSGNIVDLLRLSISDVFDKLTYRTIHNILYIGNLIQLCTGVKDIDNSLIPVNVFAENIVLGQEESIRKLRCSNCYCVVTILSKGHACRNCIKNISDFKQRNSKSAKIVSEEDTEDISNILLSVFPSASTEMQAFLQDQHKNLIRSKHGVRWDKDTIRTCLELWCRSPRSYENFKGANLFNLPSGRTLQRYKNTLSQTSGINQEILEWMFNTAQKVNLPPSGYYGGIIHDETKIQEALVLNTKGKEDQLVGFVETGVEGDSLNAIKSGKSEPVLATEVLQVTFLGYTGFRFPLAHYPTNTVTAPELYNILWDIISALQSWGFFTDYILQDGGDQNRQFMRMHFKDDADAEENSYMSLNIHNLSRKVVHSQDFSHNVKKLRNALLSSGLEKHHTRHLQKNGQYILWQMWVDAVRWDETTNSRRVNRKITSLHLYPDSAEKMRNHLAEEMLDKDFLNLMLAFQNSLKNGSALDAAVDFLYQTSALISIFRDKRPISSLQDSRLAELNKIKTWLFEWREEVNALDEMPLKDKEKCLPSRKCFNDQISLISTFVEVCKIHLKDFPKSSIFPGRYNSDIIENNFCQVRGIHNGNNTHPTYQAYRSTMNAVILGQSSKSRGRKSNVGQISADPYSYGATVSAVPKKRKVLGDISNTH